MDWDSFSDKLGSFGDATGRMFKGVFGSRNERVVKTLGPQIEAINALEPWAEGLSHEECLAKTAELRKLVQGGEKSLDDVLPESFALVRESCRRTLGMRHYDVQLVGGIVLHNGAIAEMMTGEGKTLVATLALYLNALSGRPCYLVTVNDYLARRDCAWMAPIFEYLGMSVGAIQSSMSPWDRKPIYACDIVYGTNNEFGFDYLRDNMKTSSEEQVQKVLYFAIVDEVDSILIDEARTPLIISGPAEESSDKYKQADKVARSLKVDEHYEVKEKEKSAHLLEAGIIEAEKMVGLDSFYSPGNEEWPHFIENALRAHSIYALDKEYVVEDGDQGPEVVIVDEFTGRKMNGRRWSDGLHQAVEVKEGLTPRKENQTLATITYQNYFRMFEKLSGMTGTAITEAGEFLKTYSLTVVSIPTNRPIARDDANDLVYRTEREKWNAIANEIERLHEEGQPVLVGTTSVEKSEHLSGILTERKVEHSVLNAKIGHWEREANIVARAGERAAVTVATNMAGRGTDIKLGGNFEYRLGLSLEEKELHEGEEEHFEAINQVREEVLERCASDETRVLELGGLYVLGTERHESRRIDNQLRGRSGRQGNAGTSRFYLSLEDDLMRIFYRDWVTRAMEKLGMTEGQEIESGMVTRAIAKAQKKVEDRNFEIRKNLLEYDEVMDQQRKEIYGTRQDVLESVGLHEKVLSMVERAVQRASETCFEDPAAFNGWMGRSFAIQVPEAVAKTATEHKGSIEGVLDEIDSLYKQRESTVGKEVMERIEQYVLLNAIDGRWKDHLKAIDALKAGIGLRGYGQMDPKMEYKKEGFQLFGKLFEAIEEEVASLVLRIRAKGEDQGEAQAPTAKASAGGSTTSQAKGGQAGPPPPSTNPISIRMAERFQAEFKRTGVLPLPEPPNAEDVKKRQATLRKLQAQHAQETQAQQQAQMKSKAQAAQESAAMAKALESVGRNDPCPCGSGKKVKKCHGQKT
ncbi:MAG: preprotein translocase subunit SecA [Candidatus Paceibacteria bacterium]|jgi:preprotein translocase subunit SecA